MMDLHSKVYKAQFLIVVCFSFFSINSVSADIVDTVIIDTFKKHNTKFLCLSNQLTLPKIKKEVEKRLKDSPNANDVARAVFMSFPCPFSPDRIEVKRAEITDIVGVWLFPETSIKFKYGPKSPFWSKDKSLPIKCEFVAYFTDGELRHAMSVGQKDCPFNSINDVSSFRSKPKVSSWEMTENGVVKITRTDVENHIEEWDIFTVLDTFEIANIIFESGDLIAYIKKEKGNDFNVATQFRHLKRLR